MRERKRERERVIGKWIGEESNWLPIFHDKKKTNFVVSVFLLIRGVLLKYFWDFKLLEKIDQN
jgi:hypothetical protein